MDLKVEATKLLMATIDSRTPKWRNNIQRQSVHKQALTNDKVYL